VMLRIIKGTIALRNVDIRHADFASVIVPKIHGEKTNQ